MDYKEKVKTLKKIIKEMDRVVIAFSGGVDSSLVVAIALEVLGKENVISVVADSILGMKQEYIDAIANSKKIGATTKGIFLDELKIKEIRTNQPSSWFYSKCMLYKELEIIRKKNEFKYVIDGMIMDDNFDYRPGLKARNKFDVRSPLQEADFYKSDVRQASKDYDLPTWNKPAACHFLSRFEYNDEITPERIIRVKKSESYIQSLGFNPVRVRDHKTVARIEVLQEELIKFLKLTPQIEKELTSYGYLFVSVDIKGYVYGKMNKTLKIRDKKKKGGNI